MRKAQEICWQEQTIFHTRRGAALREDRNHVDDYRVSDSIPVRFFFFFAQSWLCWRDGSRHEADRSPGEGVWLAGLRCPATASRGAWAAGADSGGRVPLVGGGGGGVAARRLRLGGRPARRRGRRQKPSRGRRRRRGRAGGRGATGPRRAWRGGTTWCRMAP